METKRPFVYPCRTVIVANGAFPTHRTPLSHLREAERIVCCDGAAERLLEYGREPDFIVGDLDSLSQKLLQRYAHRLHHSSEQETNDLTKAVEFCAQRNWKEITILAATGKREDHSIGNISLLADYAENACVQMITDYGVFAPMLKSCRFDSFAGQQVSIFSLSPDATFTFRGLKYPVDGQRIASWWQGTLNEALGDEFSVEMSGGKALVFRQHEK